MTARLRARHPDPQQDQHGRVRDGIVHRELGLPGPRNPGTRQDPRRIGWPPPRRVVSGTAGNRHRHRRLDPPAAAVTATVGVKPTYGTVSRYGLVACASSLDQGGPCARTVLDTALLHEIIAGHDPRDSTSVNVPVRADVVAAARTGAEGDLTGVKIGIVKELQGRGLPERRARLVRRGRQGPHRPRCRVIEVSCPKFTYALGAYYLILPSEVSSNLARFDAMRYGLRVGDDGSHSADEVMALTATPGSVPRSSGASSSAPTRCPRAITTPTTVRRRRCAHSSPATSRPRSSRWMC